MSNILLVCDACNYAAAPMSAVALRQRECPHCGRRMIVENDEAGDCNESSEREPEEEVDEVD